MDSMDSKPVLNDDPSVTLTIRLIMQGKVRPHDTVHLLRRLLINLIALVH